MVVRVFRVLEPLPLRLVQCAMTKPPPRLKELARQLAEALREARRKTAVEKS